MRLLSAAPGGQGKTRLLAALALRWPGPILVWDRSGDLAREGLPGRARRLGAEVGAKALALAMLDVPAGGLVVIDEAHHLIGASDRAHAGTDGHRAHPVLRVLSLCRNLGISFVLATQQPTLIPPHVGNLCAALAVGAYGVPSTRAWIQAAGFDAAPVPALHPTKGYLLEWVVGRPGEAAQCVPSDLTAAWLMDREACA